MDALNVYAKTKDLTIVGLGNSELDAYARAAASEQARGLTADPKPENGGYFRSDHFPFAKQGVPAINAGGGDIAVAKPADWMAKKKAEYTAQHYHKPSDVIQPDWDLGGAVQDLQIYFVMAYRIAQTPTFPAWSPTSEFKARRDAMMKK